MSVAVITGSNRGIGLELSRQLKSKGYDVIGICRDPSAELNELGVRIESGIDVTNEMSLLDLAERLRGIQIDLLINNAGIMTEETFDELYFENIRKQFEINTLGPLAIVKHFSHLLNDPSKVVFITSRMGSIADNTSGSYYGYRMSKAALNMAGVSLSHDLKVRNVAVGIIHPGFVKTNLTGHAGDITPEESAKNILNRIEQLTLQNSGEFWHANGDSLDW